MILDTEDRRLTRRERRLAREIAGNVAARKAGKADQCSRITETLPGVAEAVDKVFGPADGDAFPPDL